MSENDYKNIFNSEIEEKNILILKLDKINYLENIILPKIVNNESLENEIYLSILLIKYKNDLQINIIETLLEKKKKRIYLYI